MLTAENLHTNIQCKHKHITGNPRQGSAYLFQADTEVCVIVPGRGMLKTIHFQGFPQPGPTDTTPQMGYNACLRGRVPFLLG